MNKIFVFAGVVYVAAPASRENIKNETPVAGLLPVKVVKNLLSAEKPIEFLEELLFVTEWDLVRIPNFGRKGINEINALLYEKYSMRIGHLAPKRE